MVGCALLFSIGSLIFFSIGKAAESSLQNSMTRASAQNRASPL